MFLSSDKKIKFQKEKQKLRTLSTKAKLRYIGDYYKFPVIILCIVLYIIGYSIYGHATKKATVLTAAFVNVSFNDSLTKELSENYLITKGLDLKKNDFSIYSGLYLTDNEKDPNHEYTYASRMKILGAIDNQELDIVFMNQEAFDAFSQNGYLYNLDQLLSQTNASLYQQLSDDLRTNTVILEDNSIDLYPDNSVEYSAQTEEFPMGLDISSSPYIKNANMNGTIYLGIIANSPHISEAVDYINYLFNAKSALLETIGSGAVF